MIRKLTNIIAVIVLALQASAMTAVSDTVPILTARTCLSVAPDIIFPQIQRNVRLDMLDYYDAGSDKPSKNAYGGDCLILVLQEGYDDTSSVTVQVADSATMQLFVLNADSRQPIIGIVETIPTPIADSTIRFYDSKWKALTGLMPTPSLADWLTPDGKKQKEELESRLPFILASYVYDPDSKTISITQNMEEYYPEKASSEVLSALQPVLKYQWNGKTFKAVKK